MKYYNINIFYFSVLVFPPVSNYRRFLIHKTCENIRIETDIATFSIGQGALRRTVVCLQDQFTGGESVTTANR